MKVVNRAYLTLKSDFDRGNLLIRLNGQPGITDDCQFGRDEQSFVQLMFDLTERIFEAEDPSDLLDASRDLQELCARLSADLEACFASGDFESARLALAKLNVCSKKLQAAQAELERRTAEGRE